MWQLRVVSYALKSHWYTSCGMFINQLIETLLAVLWLTLPPAWNVKSFDQRGAWGCRLICLSATAIEQATRRKQRQKNSMRILCCLSQMASQPFWASKWNSKITHNMTHHGRTDAWQSRLSDFVLNDYEIWGHVANNQLVGQEWRLTLRLPYPCLVKQSLHTQTRNWANRWYQLRLRKSAMQTVRSNLLQYN